MSIESKEHPFLVELGQAIESGSSRTIVLTGNVQDLGHLKGDDGGTYVPLVDLLSRRLNVAQFVPVTYELNGPIKFVNPDDQQRFVEAWVRFHTGRTTAEEAGDAKIKRFMDTRAKVEQETVVDAFVGQLEEAAGKPAYALELLRAMCACSRAMVGGKPLFVDKREVPLHLVVIVEGADLLIPEGQASSLSEGHIHRIAICRDWFSDLGFLEGGDTVILIAESRSILNSRVGQMPQLAEVTIPSPDEASRFQFIRWFEARRVAAGKSTPKYWSTAEDLAKFTAALSIHALRQLLVAACHDGRTLTLRDIMKQVERFIQSQLGEDVVGFKQPEHTFEDVKGFRDAKAFTETDVLPGLRLTTKDALASIIICGAIGVGKTFFWEAVAAMLGIPILELKNLRSKWFGETDVVFERLRRVLEALSKVLIYVNEADTAFGGVGADTHETERRLTGKLQGMMADPRLRGKVHWLLDTARVHLLSADLRRPGRGGDLIFSMFDPEGEDRADFIRWTVDSVLEGPVDQPTFDALDAATKGCYAGAFSSLRAELRRKASAGKLTVEQVLAIVCDITPADIALERRYQTLQALLNCTRKSLRPEQFRKLEGEAWDKQMEAWFLEATKLEAAGIS